MRRIRLVGAVCVVCVVGAASVVLTSCSRKSAEPTSTTPSAAGTPGVAATSAYDAGPRAGESPVDESLAERGEPLFKSKGCSACHGFGQKLTGPDLNGVTMRRTAAWMEQQILHPEVMTKQDPISHALFAQYALQMPNQGLTPDEAKSVIEYLKHHNHEAQEAGR